MSNLITECEQLVNTGIPNEFNEADATMIGEAPARLVEWGSVSLWGQHTGTGDKSVNLRMPGILAWLKTLAASGTGPADEYNSVRYKFISSTLLPAALDHGRIMPTHEPQPRQRLRHDQPGLEPLRSAHGERGGLGMFMMKHLIGRPPVTTECFFSPSHRRLFRSFQLSLHSQPCFFTLEKPFFGYTLLFPQYIVHN
ncbi:hypothetical protein P154DRAFT_527805 [Amniculicola lignicola CBS 123094]|uniref:Uncharacterized protein n=1 Tax=Amniculicola lignicola CBS 123094 TaxID=1392246 RepID=A0A6A5VUC8_9PLEO|nr:hypothetical protein P154DRAFT_527805 [Amniculicola lignicola CBS 123094]